MTTTLDWTALPAWSSSEPSGDHDAGSAIALPGCTSTQWDIVANDVYPDRRWSLILTGTHGGDEVESATEEFGWFDTVEAAKTLAETVEAERALTPATCPECHHVL